MNIPFSAMKSLLLFCTFLLAGKVVAQCPYFSTCPTGPQLHCDYTTNDTLFWNAEPYTWSFSLMRSDLPEADVVLGTVARDSCGGQDITVEYTLFLDLDGNDTAETVIRSNVALPSGKVLYNNILSPNYALGDTIEFDDRTGLPDSMKYRFGLELTHFADSVVAQMKWITGIENLNFSAARLPMGKHRIVWRIEQGGVERFCEYGIEVKDCAPPVVSCATLPSVSIFPNGLTAFWPSDFISSASDNITPYNKLAFAVRESGQNGTGFPVDNNENPIASVIFTCEDVFATRPVELWVMDLEGKTDSCLTYVILDDNLGTCYYPSIGLIAVDAKVFQPFEAGIEGVRFQLIGTSSFYPFSYIDYSDANGHGSFGYVPLASNLTLTLSQNDNPLNGVTTYDLVLISKHILGTEPLNTPYKMIAADANKSGSVTTFDIVEIRKLILGIYDSFPYNSSWRFVERDFQFPNLLNPFQTVWPEKIVLHDWFGSPSQFEFVGIKIGDVNNTVVPNASTPPPAESRSTSFLVLPHLEMKAGETYEIPLHTTEIADWLGLQFSLDFDPELIDIEAVESSSLPGFNQNNWAQPQVGRLTLSWSDDQAQPSKIYSGAEVLSLRLKARTSIQLSKVFKTPENSRLQSKAYDLEGFIRPLQIVFSENSATEAIQVYAPLPNPTTAGATLPIQLSQAENLQLEIRDITGSLMWMNDLRLGKGSHALEIPASAMLQAGLYIWRIQAGEAVRAGKITRI